jgi:hypothetical protein
VTGVVEILGEAVCRWHRPRSLDQRPDEDQLIVQRASGLFGREGRLDHQDDDR